MTTNTPGVFVVGIGIDSDTDPDPDTDGCQAAD
jgi:hypothetical protein